MGTPRYRASVLLATLLVGCICAWGLAATAWQPLTNVPGAPHSLIAAPEFAADKQLPHNPFYDAPNPLPDVIPGTLLKEPEAIAGAPAGIRALRIMYMSTAVDGKPVAITGAFFERTEPAAGPTGRPLIGFTHGTTGLAPMCGISQGPFVSGTTGAQFYRPEIAPLLEAGYAVVGTDYQNMGAVGTPSYLVAQSEAYAVLDSIRAALNLAPSNLDGNKIGVIGHSQGGQAALAAGQYRDEYAPELAIRGVVSQAPGMVVGLPIVIKAIVSGNSGSQASRSEYVSFITESWSKTYPDSVKAEDIMTPAGLAMLPLTQQLCGPPLRDHFNEPLSTYIKSSFPPDFLRIANLNVPDKPMPMPLLMTQGMDDTAIVPQFSIATFRAICRTNTVAELRTYRGDDHNSLLWTARPDAVDWLNARMAGEPAANGCRGRH